MKVLVYNLANVQCLNPFLFKDILIDYLQIGQIIMSNVEWFSERVVKSSIIALLKVLRCYHYYLNYLLGILWDCVLFNELLYWLVSWSRLS